WQNTDSPEALLRTCTKHTLIGSPASWKIGAEKSAKASCGCRTKCPPKMTSRPAPHHCRVTLRRFHKTPAPREQASKLSRREARRRCKCRTILRFERPPENCAKR